jgi:double-stranded uracil-DNA glycosylase
MTICYSFPALADENARVLILGSMPGRASLAAGQYYAHPRNQFWPIIGDLTGTDARAPYDQRVAALLASRIALWDVLQSCARPGSLDADISDEIPNDFVKFFTAHPLITRVFFNGGKAESSFQRHVLPGLEPRLEFTHLPSTSPAHAGMSYAGKLAAWRAVTPPTGDGFEVYNFSTVMLSLV